MRMIFLLLALMVTPVFAQQDNSEALDAVHEMDVLRREAHSITIDPYLAPQFVARAIAAANSLPAPWPQSFQNQIKQMQDTLAAAARSHGKGDGKKAQGDGGYGVVMGRVAAGKWTGVAKVANGVAENYRKAIYYYRGASMGYTQARSSATAVINDVEGIRQYLDDMDAMEDDMGGMGDMN